MENEDENENKIEEQAGEEIEEETVLTKGEEDSEDSRSSLSIRLESLGDRISEGAEEVIEEESEGEDEGEEEDEEPEPPIFMKPEEPTQEEDKAKFWILKDPSIHNKEVASAHGLNESTVRIARNHLENDQFLRKDQRPPKPPGKDPKGKALTASGPEKNVQVFAKGSPPEQIINSISIPLVEGQSEGFEQGMKFGMAQLVLAVRIVQELSAIGMQQVKPLIDMTRSVREGETAAFKSGADEAAMKSAQAMGSTILPMISELQATVSSLGKGSETDPMKSMMVRTMEPLMKNMMKSIMPGVESGPPAGFSKETQ